MIAYKDNAAGLAPILFSPNMFIIASINAVLQTFHYLGRFYSFIVETLLLLIVLPEIFVLFGCIRVVVAVAVASAAAAVVVVDDDFAVAAALQQVP